MPRRCLARMIFVIAAECREPALTTVDQHQRR
jgi:hypothetical protein